MMQKAWDARDPHGRIKILLSEHLAGISWPISNRLYLLNQRKQHSVLMQGSTNTKQDPRLQKTASETSGPSTLSGSQLSASGRILRSNAPAVSNFAIPPVRSSSNSTSRLWNEASPAMIPIGDDIMMSSRPAKHWTSNAHSTVVPNFAYISSLTPKPLSSHHGSQDGQMAGLESEHPQPKAGNNGQLIVSLEDNQFGQMIEATSPSKKRVEWRQDSNGQYRNKAAPHPPILHGFLPSNIGGASPVPPSAVMARMVSSTQPQNSTRLAVMRLPTSDFQNLDARKERSTMHNASISSTEENQVSQQSRIPTPFGIVNRVQTPDALSNQLSRSQSDFTVGDSFALGTHRFDQNNASFSHFEPGDISRFINPALRSNSKTRKEGINSNSHLTLDQAAMYNDFGLRVPGQSISRPTSASTRDRDKQKQQQPPAPIEVIDVDALDEHPHTAVSIPHDTTDASPPKPKSKHKYGVSSIASMDSTARLERQLYSALGEELGSFEHVVETPSMGPELATALGSGDVQVEGSAGTRSRSVSGEGDSSGKRKRGERKEEGEGEGEGESPVGKRERGG
ncbi:hypothetical protein IQ07DRAFT_634275 [Pyrenochaeta sp. DS3sAY3a]|nr:hypothetical protein IQ07DRAFT_634275 [Pyrenochaeta sp. DS3sAY3a]